MSFNPNALSLRTLKQFVDRAHKIKKQQTHPDTWPPKRSAIQEEIAQILGFSSWHHAVQMIEGKQDKRPKPASSSEYLYPHEPVTWDKETFLALVHWFHQQGGGDIHLQPRHKMKGEIFGQTQVLSQRELALTEINDILKDLYGSDLHRCIEGTKDLAFSYKDKNLRFHTLAQRTSDGVSQEWTANIQFLPSLPPKLEVFGFPSSLTDLMIEKKGGLILFSSQTGHGSKELMGAVVRKIIEDTPHQRVHTWEDTVSFDLQQCDIDPSNVVLQHELKGGTYSEGIRNSLRRRASVIMLGEARDSETIREAVTAAMTGYKVYTSVTSFGVANTLRRMTNSFDMENRGSSFVDLLASLHVVVSLQQVQGNNGVAVTLKESLVFDEQTQDQLIEAGMENLSMGVFKALEDQKTGFWHDAYDKHRQGLISDKTLEQVLRRKPTFTVKP